MKSPVGLFSLLLLAAAAAHAGDRFDRLAPYGEPRERHFSYEYDPRSPYSQHPLYRPEYRQPMPPPQRLPREPAFDRHPRGLGRGHYWHYPPPAPRQPPHYHQQMPPQQFYYGPYPSYPTYRYYR